jgi:uncharacterized protein YbaA (DUF1428 family)
MAKYVDGFVAPVPKKNIEAYRAMARKAGKIFLEHGATAYTESLADDVPFGKTTSFPRSVDRKNSETVALSWVTYKSKAQRDKANAKIMKDPRLLKLMEENGNLFDASRMLYGGFEVIVDL